MTEKLKDFIICVQLFLLSVQKAVLHELHNDIQDTQVIYQRGMFNMSCYWL